MNTETQLQYLLEHLRTRLLVMCVTVEETVENACTALLSGNIARAEAIIEHDARIDELENEIDEAALSLLARTQPVARDLRFVVGALRMVIDLERIGDEAAAVAERSLLMQDLPTLPRYDRLERMLSATQKALHETISAFREGDAALALQICRGEEEIVQMEVHLIQEIMDRFADGSNEAENKRALHLILIARSFNRIFRRTANIAEHTYFMASGVDIKHKKPATQQT